MAAEQALYDWLGRDSPRIKARYPLEGMRSLRQDLLALFGLCQARISG